MLRIASPLGSPVVAVVCVALLTLAGCSRGSSSEAVDGGDRATATATQRPELGACRRLDPGDLARSTDDTDPVPCTQRHTAQTFAVGTFPDALAARGPDDRALGAYVYRRCNAKFQRFLGGDDSLVLRSVLTWAWFRPSDEVWKAGGHSWRCDAVGGGEQSPALVPLPRSARGLLLGKPDDRWLVCVNGPSVTGSVKIPCSRPHTWRAVTTVVLGKTGDPYPGDRLSEVRTKQFCSGSVGAWLSYPVDYDYGYTWFHEAEWKTGNRRSICWARTSR